MAGVKGRSGRKSWDKERDLHRLWDLSVPILVHALTAADVPTGDKRQIALKLVEKMTPQAMPESFSPFMPQPRFIFHIGTERHEVNAQELLSNGNGNGREAMHE